MSWRAVSWGLGLQFALGLFVIRTEPGFVAFQWLGEQIRVSVGLGVKLSVGGEAAEQVWVTK